MLSISVRSSVRSSSNARSACFKRVTSVKTANMPRKSLSWPRIGAGDTNATHSEPSFLIRANSIGDVSGDRFPIRFFLDDSVYVSEIQFICREEVVTDLGRFRCLKFKPMVISGNVFSKEYPMDLWISDDGNHIPVFASSAVIVGSVKLELISYEGLSKPLTSLIEPAKK